jgi:hypothetical protein
MQEVSDDTRIEARFGGRIGYAGGGISRLVDRQGYFLGSVFKGITKGVKGIVKGVTSAVKKIAKFRKIALAVQRFMLVVVDLNSVALHCLLLDLVLVVYLELVAISIWLSRLGSADSRTTGLLEGAQVVDGFYRKRRFLGTQFYE